MRLATNHHNLPPRRQAQQVLADLHTYGVGGFVFGPARNGSAENRRG